jgi:HSP20 family protein
MTLMRLNTFPALFRDFDELFRDYSAPRVETDGNVRTLTPPVDIVEHDKNVELRLDLPGVLPEEIDVKLDGNLLTITAERKNEAKTEDKGWVRQERTWGKYIRSFTLPTTVDGTKPEASYKHGVLLVTLPKREEAQPRSLKVKVEA